MSDMLDDIPDDALRKKLQDYSEAPDEDLWNNIASGVKDNMPLSQRLRTFEEAPDDAVWMKISSGVMVEHTLLWLERTGRFAALVSFLLLISPIVNQNLKTPVAQETIASSDSGSIEANDSLQSRAPEKRTSVTPATGSSTDFLKTQPGRNRSDIKRAHDEKTAGQPDVSSDFSDDHNKGSLSVVKSSATNKNPAVNEKNPITTAENNDHDMVETQLTHTLSPVDSTSLVKEKYGLEQNSIREDAVTSMGELVNEHRSDPTDSAREEHVVKKAIPVKADTSKEEEKKKEAEKKRRHGSIYGLLMPTFGYQQIKPVQDDNLLIESIEKVSTFSSKRLGVRAEAGFEGMLKRKFSYNIGVLYFQRKQTINYTFRDASLIDVELLDADSLLYKVNLPQDSATFEYELKNIGVVLGLNYTTKVGRFVHKVGIAAEVHRSLASVNKEVDTGQRFFLFGDVYYRVSYPISRRFEVMFQPTLNYALQVDSELNAPFYVKPFGLGLNFGGAFHF